MQAVARQVPRTDGRIHAPDLQPGGLDADPRGREERSARSNPHRDRRALLLPQEASPDSGTRLSSAISSG